MPTAVKEPKKKAPSRKKADPDEDKRGHVEEEENAIDAKRRELAQLPGDDADDDDDDIEELVNDNQDPKGSAVERQNAEAEEKRRQNEQESREKEIEKAQAELEKLDPTTDPVRRVIGQPPEHGGGEDNYLTLVQDKLPWMPRQRFFALVGKTMSTAIKATGGDVGGMADVFGAEGGSLIERGRRLTQRDFTDAASFFSLAMELVGYSPDFLIECYVIWLDVPRRDRGWAKQRFNEPWDPEKGKWGLKDEDHEDIIQTFIDQNYEEIRRFFVETLPGIARRVALHERSRKRAPLVRESKSDQ